MSHHVIFIHGIGDAALKVSEAFERNAEKEIVHMDVKIHTFLWKQLVSRKEDGLKKKLGRLPRRALLLSLGLNLKENIETYLIGQLRQHLIGYFGDAVFYLSKSSAKIRLQLERELLEISRKDKKARISLVAHSLGSVIAFDMLSDKQFQKKMRKKRLVIEDLFTVGSPLALFLLRPDTSINARLPLVKKWINIYDKRDVIASPLSIFFGQCKDLSVKVQDSNPLTVHANYFNDPIVLNEILGSLA